MKNNNLPSIIVLGHGAHGKDTVCEMLPDEFEFINSSYAACEIAVFPELSKLYGYNDIEECYQDRRNHRLEWKKLISDYNADDLTKLGRDIFNMCNVYNGIRARNEFEALIKAHVIDYTIFVDACTRLPDLIDPSMDMSADDADFIINNNGSIEDLEREVYDAIGGIMLDWKEL